MATIAYNICLARMTFTEGEPPIFYCPEGNSQSFLKGEPVFNSFGYLIEIAGDTPGQIYGIAAQAGANSATAQTDGVMCPVFLALPTAVFEATMKESALADHVSVASDFGTVMAIQRDTTNSKLALNASTKNGGTSVRVYVHGPGSGSVVGDTNPRALFTFLPNWVQFLGTS
jgi:hypothetical protein